MSATPEERAAAITTWLAGQAGEVWTDVRPTLETAITAAIRDAVEAETAACARHLEEHGICRCEASAVAPLDTHDPDCPWRIAGAIRQRMPAHPATEPPAA